MNDVPLKGKALPALVFPGITDAQVASYMAVSGDDNPLHTDLDIAGRLGLPAVPVPGMLIMAQVARFVREWPHCGRVMKLKARFVRPVLVGREFVVGGRVAMLDVENRQAVLRVIVEEGGRPAVLAEAAVGLRTP